MALRLPVRPARRAKHRIGFTLVELLVVIAIIAMLASLLLPAVQGARAAARKTQCINNQHNLAIAVIRYEQNRQRYPGWSNNQNPNTNGVGGRQGSWVWAILPELDRLDIYNNYGSANMPGNTSTASAPMIHLKIVICPDDAESINNGTSLSYAVNSGRFRDSRKYTGSNEPSAVGVFTYQYRGSVNDSRTYTNSSMPDGVATTFMLSENVDAGSWLGRHSPTDTGNDVQEGCVGFTWIDSASPGQYKPNSGSGTARDCRSGTIGTTLPRPASYHAGGFVASFCDGHVQFVSEDVSYTTFQMLCTPNGRACPTPQGLLNENAY